MKAVIFKKSIAQSSKSKIYIKYEKLLNEIELQRQFISNLDEGLQKAYAKITTELSPLDKEHHGFLRDYILRLNQLVNEIGIGKYNREWFESYMADELAALMEYFGHQDKVISALYQNYAQTTIDEMAGSEEAIEMARSLTKLFGFEVDFKEILEKGEKAYFEENKDKIRDHVNKNKETIINDFFDAEAERKTGKSKQINKKDEQEANLFVKDARSIYMRLIKKFHPDLETDHAIKEEKTEIVKQVTQAYQANDFFTLLKLQIIYVEDNEAEATVIADDILKRYNNLLQKQLNELTEEVNEMHFGSGDIISDFIDKNGKFSAQRFAARRRALVKENDMLKATLADSKRKPKTWFKDQIAMIKDLTQRNMMNDILGGYVY